MKLLSKKWRNICARYAAQRRRKEQMELMQTISVKEYGNRIYLTCCGVAFMQIPPETTAAEVVEQVERARAAAVSFTEVNTEQ